MSEIKWYVISSLHVCDNHRCPITYWEQLSLYCPLQTRFENSCCLIPGLFCSSENPLLLKSRRSHAAHEPLSKDFILCCLQWKALMSQDSDSCVRIGHYVWSTQADPCPSTSLQTVRWKNHYWSAAVVSFEIILDIHWPTSLHSIVHGKNTYTIINKNNTTLLQNSEKKHRNIALLQV